MIRFSLFLFIVFLIVCSCTNSSHPESRSAFDSTLAIHLEAIRTANLQALEPTVADSVTLISPYGQRMSSKETFMNLHKNWFKEKNWEWTAEILNSHRSDSLAYTLLKYRYTEKDSVGNSKAVRDNYLVLIFKNTAQGWQLIHDQNTKLP